MGDPSSIQRARLLGLMLDKSCPAPPQPLADRGAPPPPSPPKHSKRQAQKTPPLRTTHPSDVLGHRRSQSPLVEESSLPRTQEQPVTLRRRAPRNTQSPSEEEDPEAASHPWRKSSSHFLRPRSSQPPRRKRTQENPDTIGTRDLPCPPSKAEMGRRQSKSTYNNMKNKTSPESSPPPTPRPEHCNVDKAEENDLKNSLIKMIEEALEGKMKNATKEIEEKTNKKLEKMNKEIEENN
ncbi:hypothetical protein STEG23_012665 [Scotinomys teguina]